MAMTKNPSSFVLLVAIVLVSSASIGHAQDDAALGIRLRGTLYCTPTGNRMNGVRSSGADGVNVTLSCGLGCSSTIATSVTNSQGVFNITATASLETLGNAFRGNCEVMARLPPLNSTCRRLPLFGKLKANVNVTGLDVNQNYATFILSIGMFYLSLI